MKMKPLISIFLLIFIKINSQEKETVEFHVKTHQNFLAGEVIKPKSQSNKRIPAIVFVVGSGESSYRTNYKTFSKYFLEEPLQNHEIAIVNFDKAGIGKSTGKWYKTTIEKRAEDVIEIVRYLKQQDYIDPKKIFIVGHSQGGWISQLCLSKYSEEIAGAISMAGATYSVKKQLINDFQSEFICNENLNAEDALKKAERKTNRIVFLTSALPIKPKWNQIKKIKNFDIEPYLKTINKPLLYMWADNDQLVNPDWSLQNLHNTLGERLPENISTYVGKNQNHSFEIALFCRKDWKKERQFSNESRDIMINWLLKKIYN